MFVLLTKERTTSVLGPDAFHKAGVIGGVLVHSEAGACNSCTWHRDGGLCEEAPYGGPFTCVCVYIALPPPPQLYQSH